MSVPFSDIHQAKYDLISLGMPVDLAIDFGPAFRPQYINYMAKNGADRALAIDFHKAEFDNGIEFHKANFSEDAIVPWVANYRKDVAGFCLGVSFDTLLHQYAPIHVLMNLLSVLDSVCIGTPVLKKQTDSCTFLPAVPKEGQEKIFPFSWMDQELGSSEKARFSDLDKYSWGHWLWGLNDTLLKAWISREGFKIEEERRVSRPGAWDWWGCYATRK